MAPDTPSATLSPALAPPARCSVEESAQESASTRARHPLTLGTTLSYFAPTKEERQIQTVFVDVLVGVNVWDLLGIDIYGGLTSTVAWGWITQFDDQFNDVRFDTQVGGIGPVFALRAEPLRPLCFAGCAGFSLALDASGALVLYSAHFPPGGDIYNLAWRVGGAIGYSVTPRWRIELGGRWMHVSNGQGIGAFNPSYEGVGVTLGSQLTL
jgi:hypothetical protein